MSNVDKQIGGKERKDDPDALAVFPNPEGFIASKKRLHVSHVKVLDHRLFALRKGEDSLPIALVNRVSNFRVQTVRAADNLSFTL